MNEITNTIKQKVKNENEMSNYSLQCINCGSKSEINLVAHRNKNKNITGFIVFCDDCCVLLNKCEKDVRMVVE